MGKIRRSRNQREHVSIITSEWVEMHCARLTDRDKEILKLLSMFHVMSSRHLFILCPGSSREKPFHVLNQGQQRCNDRIRVLYDLHCVNKFSPLKQMGEGTSVQYVWLDRAGAKILGIENFRRRKDLQLDYLHTSGILDTYCAIIQMQRNAELEIKYVDVETTYATWPLIPDLLYIVKMASRGYIFIIEVDRSEKKEKDELNKIQSYRDWQLSNQWLQEKWANIMPVPRFPRVIYAFDESKSRWQVRAKKFQRKADEVGLRMTTCGLSKIEETIKSLGGS